ncbi:MAG: PHP domain-containing protein [Promethearchaeota archaeon]
MDFPRLNFHIHSRFSDGENSIKQIVRASLKLGLKYIAITDHFSDSWKARVIPTLNSVEKIDLYLKKLKDCKDFLFKSNKNLLLFSGIEIDLSSSENFIRKLIHPEKFDLILFEYMETLEGIAFVKNLINRWKENVKKEKLPLFGLAHFDPSFFIHDGFDILINFLENNEIYFEFNSSYSKCYSRKNEMFFKKLKDYNVPVAIGCDSHALKFLNDYEDPVQMIIYYGLERNYMLFLDKIMTKKTS